MTHPVSLRKPPAETVTATFCALTLAHVEQIDTFWRAILQAAQEPDISWDWAYKLRLAVNDSRYEAYAIESVTEGASACTHSPELKPFITATIWLTMALTLIKTAWYTSSTQHYNVRQPP